MGRHRDEQRGVFKADPKAAVNDELGFHVDRLTNDLIARGLSPERARAEALRKFGDLDRVRAECERLETSREHRRSRAQWIHDFATDVCYGARSLVRQPLFTLAAAITLGLGIGANAAIFSAVDALFLRPLPVRNANELYVIAAKTRDFEFATSTTYSNFQAIRARRDVFSDVVAFQGMKLSMRVGNGDAEPLFTGTVSPNYFDALGVRAIVGRTFSERDGEQRLPYVVVSQRLWERKFQSDASAIGSAVIVNGIPYTLVGVVPRSFTGTLQFLELDAYVPVTTWATHEPAFAGLLESHSSRYFRLIARVKRDVPDAVVQSVLTQVAAERERRHPEDNPGLQFVSAPELRSRPDIGLASRTPVVMAVFVALVGLLLLVACANVANLLLVRATRRQADIALRRALGASGSRIMRQLVTESVLLALFGLVLGALLGRAGTAWVNSLRFALDAPVAFGLQMNWRVFGLAALAAGLAGVIAGLAPAVFGARLGLTGSLSESGRGGSSSHVRRRVRQLLVVAQVAGSVVLLVFAGLFARSVREALSSDLGFRTNGLVLMDVDVALQRYDSTRGKAFFAQLRERAAALPGVRRAVMATSVPFGGNISSSAVVLEHPTAALPDGSMDAWRNVVSDGYFSALGIRLLRGREFTAQDDSASPPVVIVNEAFAKRVWPNEEAIGKRLRTERGGPLAQVVGVVGNNKYLFVNEEPWSFVYQPLTQRYQGARVLQIETDAPAQALAGPLRQIVRELDAGMLVSPIRTIESHLRNGNAFFFTRLAATLATALGIIGLIQALVGLYGVLAFTVGLRTRELGLRMALGASRGRVLRSVFGEGGALVGAGLLIGIALSAAATQVVRAALVGVGPIDLLAYGGACLVLATCAAAACYIPARRAARIEPLSALRYDG
ncbi:MAG: ADOP family duplicated permease [Gemmatimonadaceae bacterium]